MKLFLILLLALFIFPTLVLAQNSPSTAEVLAPTDIQASRLDEIGRFKVSRPIDEDKIDQARQYFNFSDQLNTLPGVQMRTSGSPIISLRGSQSSGRVLVLQEDIPLNFSDGVGFNPLFLTPELSDSVSILKGPASSSFGHDAMDGAIAFKTKRLHGLESFVSDGSFGETEAFAGYGYKSAKFYSQISAYQEHADGNYPYSVPRTPPGTFATRVSNDQEILRSTLLFGGTTGEGETKLTWKTYHLLARQLGSIPGEIDFLFPQSFNNLGHLHSLDLALSFPNNWIVSSLSTLALLGQNYAGSTSQTESLRETLRVQKDFKYFLLEVFDEISIDQFVASYLQGGAQYLTLNEVGANIQIPLEEKLIGTASVRSDISTGDVLPSFGITAENEDHWKYFVHYSLGYHPPSLTQKYTQFTGFIGNPGLHSEHSQEVDLGFEKSLSGVDFKFEVFQRAMTDLIENHTVAAFTLSPQNTGSAQSFGFEGQAKTRTEILTESLDIGANISYLNSQNTTLNRPLLFSPQTQISAFLEKQLSHWNIKIQDTTWSSYFDLNSSNNLVSLGPWTTVDVFMSYSLSSCLRLQLAVLNIFDQARELSLNYPEPQRSYKLMIAGQF